jgi:hypothetical protein
VIITINESNAAQYNALFAKAYQALNKKGLIRPGAEHADGRFHSIDEYFAHLEYLYDENITYLMMPLDETPFVINANTRAISAPKIVIVQNDQVAETVMFTIDRYFDYMDLNNAIIYVQWTLPSGKEGSHLIEMKDIASIPGKIRFGWPLDNEVTSEVGTVKYSVRFWNKGFVPDKDNNPVEKVVYSFNTLTSTLNVNAALQPEINDDIDVNAPVRDNIFKRAIMNSQLTGEGIAVPVNPLFSEPGADLPSTASLIDDTLTLRAQAIVGDTGHVEYEWYYMPAVTVDEFIAGNYYPYNEQTVTNDDGTTTTIPGFSKLGGKVDKNVNEVYVEVTGLTSLVRGEQYYVEASDTSTGYIAYTGTTVPENEKLYERYTTYTVPEGDVKVTGNYEVRATNYIEPNTSKPVSSTVCRLVSPADVVFADKGNLADKAIIDAEKGLTLKVSLVPDASGASVSYDWSKKTVASGDAVEIEGVNTSSLVVEGPGWYQVKALSTLNRETKDATSAECKVTFAPAIPAMSYGTNAQAVIDAGSVVNMKEEDGTEWKAPLYGAVDGSNITLDLSMASVVPTEYSGYDTALFSEEMSYAWGVQAGEEAFRYLTDADVGNLVVSGLGTSSLVVKSPAGTTQHMFKCIVSNKLNGLVVTGSESDALPFYVM